MENKLSMEIEDIAQIDLFLRTFGDKSLFKVEDLIIADGNIEAINKFKEAAYNLNELQNSNAPKELIETWQNLFNKQVKFSVNRAKEKRKK